ncbi:hypothetical protein J2X68_007727 [Streptomyces sp. 3330]|nr:hypothetical protein [Streptomyces sp. 3330]
MREIDLLGPKEIMGPALESVFESVEAVFSARLRYESSEPESPDGEWGRARHAFEMAHGTFVESASQALRSDQI